VSTLCVCPYARSRIAIKNAGLSETTRAPRPLKHAPSGFSRARAPVTEARYMHAHDNRVTLDNCEMLSQRMVVLAWERLKSRDAALIGRGTQCDVPCTHLHRSDEIHDARPNNAKCYLMDRAKSTCCLLKFSAIRSAFLPLFLESSDSIALFVSLPSLPSCLRLRSSTEDSDNPFACRE